MQKEDTSQGRKGVAAETESSSESGESPESNNSLELKEKTGKKRKQKYDL